MKEDYLWDKSGEPDPEIQELEQTLAPLRYQPKPPAIPQRPRRNYLPFAIAATVLLALLITGVWLRLRTPTSDQPQQQAKSVPFVFKEEAPKPVVIENTDLPKKPFRKRKNNSFNRREREEALEAKQQLMFALRLASEKLKSAHKKTQGVRS